MFLEQGYMDPELVIGYGPLLEGIDPEVTPEVTLMGVADDGRTKITDICLDPEVC